MKKEITIRRKVSAIVALALAVAVTFTAALDSYGDSNTDLYLSSELEASVEEAYESLVEENTYYTPSEENREVIKIYNADFELLKEVVLEGDEVLEDKETQMLMNRASFLSSFSNTSVYKVLN